MKMKTIGGFLGMYKSVIWFHGDATWDKFKDWKK